ncbi:MAG: hypothetical protein ACRCX2_21940 [Paraclostridium sp.]
MRNYFKKELNDILLNGTKEERIYLCENSLPYFAAYYYSDMFTYRPADVHFDMYEDFEKAMRYLTNDSSLMVNAAITSVIGEREEPNIPTLRILEIDTIIWTAHRGLGKTSIAKIAIIWAIVYHKINFLVYASYNAENARAVLFDVVNELSTNRLLIEDFGELFTASMEEIDSSLDSLDIAMGKRKTRKKKMKKATSFITENGIKVMAYSTMQSLRGLLFNNNRPDFLVLDDFETNDTRHSSKLTARINDFINEAKTALAPRAVKLFLTNYITDDGNVAELHNMYKGNPRAIVRNIPLYWKDKNSNKMVLSWDAKYTFTDKEAIEYNTNQRDSKKHKISVESIRRDVGELVFEIEYMNNPSSHDGKLFLKATIEKLLNIAKTFIQIASLGSVKMYEKFIPGHAYGIGCDVGSGTGGDSSAIVVIDFSQTPQKIVATWADNRTPPMQLAYLLAKVGETYGNAVIAVENNGLGIGVVHKLAEIYDNIYTTKKRTANGLEETKTLGFTSTGGRKKDIVYRFQEAVVEDNLIITDEELVEELSVVRDKDFEKAESGKSLGTRHLDKFIAACIAYETKTSAYASTPASHVSNIDNSEEVEFMRNPVVSFNGFSINSLDIYK